MGDDKTNYAVAVNALDCFLVVFQTEYTVLAINYVTFEWYKANSTVCQCNALNYDSDMRHLAVLLDVIMLTLLTDKDGSSNAVRKKKKMQHMPLNYKNKVALALLHKHFPFWLALFSML